MLTHRPLSRVHTRPRACRSRPPQIHKPTVIIRYSDVESAEVQRYSGEGDGASRTWDLVVKCRAAQGEKAGEYSFTQIDRKEKTKLVDFFKARAPPVRVLENDRGGKRAAGKNYAEDDGDDDDDEEGGAGGGADEDEEDDDDEDDEVRASASARARAHAHARMRARTRTHGCVRNA